MLVEENKPLAPLTTFGIGGPARWFVEAGSEEEIAEAASWADGRGLPVFVLGGGSNLLVSDSGFDGLVLRVGLQGIAAVQHAETNTAKGQEVSGRDFSRATQSVQSTGASAPAAQTIFQVAAGVDWDYFVAFSVEAEFAGIECLAGIPGTVGGTPVQNVGAYGQDVASSIERVRVFDLQTRAFVEFAAAECGFSYRRSRFNSADRGRYIVTRVDYRLTFGGPATVRYAELHRALENAGNGLALTQVAAQVRRLRQSKGMLLVDDDPDCRSAGSFFKNPVVTDEQFQQIAAASPAPPPRFPAGPDLEGRVKIPAAWLIEQAGFSKGFALGQAAISSRHTLALTNRGRATASEVLALAGQIADTVSDRFGIRLEMEPVLVGF
jgi:UDP-N-acetylmuramate dehydrogenase